MLKTIQARLGGPLAREGTEAAIPALFSTRAVPLILGHFATLYVCVAAMHRVGGPLPAWLTAASLAVLLARLPVLASTRHLASAQRRRRLRVNQAMGLAWSAIGGALCGFCTLAVTDDVTQILGLVLGLGVTAGIAARNVATPWFALAQIGLWVAPLLALAPYRGTAYWTVSGAVATYAASMAALARLQHRDALRMIAAGRDKQMARLALSQREAGMNHLFETSMAGVAEYEAGTGRLLRVNPELCRMLGRSAAELLAGPDPALPILPEDMLVRAASWAAFFEFGTRLECESRFSRADGSIMHGRCNATIALASQDGSAMRLALTVYDITGRKEAEAALRASEDMLRLSLDIGGIGSYRRDAVANVFHCALHTREMLGFPTDVSVPVPRALWTAMVIPEDMACIERDFTVAFTEQRPFLSFEYRLLHPRLGVRHIETRSRVEYDPAGQPVSTVNVVIDVTDRYQAEARFAHLAHHDSLTGLPNRALFGQRLDDALARAGRGERFAVCCLDLDHFKYVNDALGHPVGDMLLQSVTARLRAELRATDTVARLGGDEFAIIQVDIRHADDASTLAQRVIQSVSAPYQLDGHHVVIGTSIGIALSPDDGLDAVMLLRHADTALYAAKEAGRGGYRFFEYEMDARMQARRSMELDLREAIESEAFELYYQPIMNVAGRDLCGFEALLRWNHPTRGMVMPDRFIGVAEANGLIVPIGEWVLRRACTEAANWPGAARVAVNLAAVHFTSGTLVESVSAALRQSGLDPARLDLEITESAMLTDTETTLERLHELKALGVSISMDDFGTGFSSLSYLQRFPFDKVKIDHSFITDLGRGRESAAIVGAVIALCAGLDMRTTAEGVETEEQFAALAKIGCTEAQGYLFSRPLPARDIPALIEKLAVQPVLQAASTY